MGEKGRREGDPGRCNRKLGDATSCAENSPIVDPAVHAGPKH